MPYNARKRGPSCSTNAASTPRPCTPRSPSPQNYNTMEIKAKCMLCKRSFAHSHYCPPQPLAPQILSLGNIPFLEASKDGYTPLLPQLGEGVAGEFVFIFGFGFSYLPVYLEGEGRERYQVSQSSHALIGGYAALPRPLVSCAQGSTAPPPALRSAHPSSGWSEVCQLRGLRGRVWPGVPWRPQLAHPPDSPVCNLSRCSPSPQAWGMYTAVSLSSSALEWP